MKTIKGIDTEYDGYLFRSRLEARWAVFFNECGIKYEYETEGFELQDGTRYLPDFKIFVRHRHYTNEYEPIFVEVKGMMTNEDLKKIELFAKEYPILVLSNIPKDDQEYIEQWHSESYYNNYRYIDGDEYPALFSLHNGEVWIAGPDHEEYDGGNLMNNGLIKARQARFEYVQE